VRGERFISREYFFLHMFLDFGAQLKKSLTYDIKFNEKSSLHNPWPDERVHGG
jgi:hypothetical protein